MLLSELERFGLKVHSSNRGGAFFSTKEPKALIQFLETTKVSSQVGFVILHINVEDYDDFYNQVVEFHWEDILDQNVSFRLDSKTKDNLPDSRFAMYRLKDAILDRFRNKNQPFPDIKKDNADISFFLRSYMDHAVVEVLLHNRSLTKKGYRSKTGDATLRENLASAMLEFAGWTPIKDSVLIDPFCGQGTILIQAALDWKSGSAINRNIFDESYVFQSMFASLSEKIRGDASISGNMGPSNSSVTKEILFIGMDISEESLELARKDAKNAGVSDLIHWECKDISELDSILQKYQISKNKPFELITDPPFGNRLGTKEEAKSLYTKIGKVLKDLQAHIHFTIITGDSSLLGFLKLKKEKEMSLKNSGIPSKIVHYIVQPREPKI